MIRESASDSAELRTVALDLADGRTALVFTRDFDHARERVWSLLTEPDQLVRWSPYTADRNLASVGKVTFTMLGDLGADGRADVEVPGAVLISEEPASLEHSWGTDVLAWELKPRSNGSVLILRHSLSDPAMASAAASGWHLCLDVAEDVLTGRPTAPIRGMDAMNHGWPDLNQRYAAALGVEPSSVGGER